MSYRTALTVAALAAIALSPGAAISKAAPAPTQDFNGANFEINRDRVKFGTLKTCAKGTTYLVPTTYLYVTARTKLSAGGGLGNAKSKARVFIEGLTRSELQGLSGQITDEIVSAAARLGLHGADLERREGRRGGQGALARQSQIRHAHPRRARFPGYGFLRCRTKR